MPTEIDLASMPRYQQVKAQAIAQAEALDNRTLRLRLNQAHKATAAPFGSDAWVIAMAEWMAYTEVRMHRRHEQRARTRDRNGL